MDQEERQGEGDHAHDNDSALQALKAEAEVLASTISAMQRLTPAGREKVLRTLTTFFGNFAEEPRSSRSVAQGHQEGVARSLTATTFSEDRTPSPKAFLLDKRPTTDVERVTCLGYYLAHYRDTPSFKTIDISKLNTEAAQIKLSNPTIAVENAVKAGFLVAAGKGNKQISAVGEIYVQELPDRQAARAAVAHARPRRRQRKSNSSQNKQASPDEQ